MSFLNHHLVAVCLLSVAVCLLSVAAGPHPGSEFRGSRSKIPLDAVVACNYSASSQQATKED